MKIKRSKFRESAHMRECTVEWAGVGYHNPETTVAAHIGLSGCGTAKRRMEHDVNAVYACADCHDLLDGRVIPADVHAMPHTAQMDHGDMTAWIRGAVKRLNELERERDHWFYAFRALVRTLEIRFRENL